MAISKKVAERIVQQLKRYQGVLTEAKNRDINESDTVVIIADMLADIFGYKKYVEITTEFAIRSTYVDLAVKVGLEVRFLIEAKAVGVALKDFHVKQAIDYGANQGVEWVILTNGIVWQVYKIQFRQPVDKVLIYEVDLLNVNPKNTQIIESFGNLSREGFTSSSMAAFCQQQQATSKFSLAAIILSPPLLQAIKKELRRISSSIKIEDDYLKAILQNEVLKREVVESDDAKQAMDFLKKSLKTVSKPKVKVQATSPAVVETKTDSDHMPGGVQEIKHDEI
ncbi:MAG: type I restriction enzyme HsdR N-terminal domain-containing protein [Proteobacteria bacterium]|nr:type I restriction enzyme HsdR N-terminal domain-containing protein [Pseudomonadota bacterium]